MKRFLLSFFFSLLGFVLIAQIPDGYYDGAAGLKGKALKTALYNIIKGHTTYPYTSSSTDVWDILKETDRDTANPDNVILLYTGRSVNAAQEYNNGKGWSREHVWAKSRGDFDTDPPAGTDAHNLRPADISVNSARSNRWFDSCTVKVYDDGVFTGSYTSTTRWVWQPRKEVKGDVARMIFYMATRYEGENGEPDLQLIDYLPADVDTREPLFAMLHTLLRWSEEDPVDAFERHRNDVVYSYQHNRNPFIDHPEYVQLIWGDTTATAIPHYAEANFSVYPNPVSDVLHFSGQVPAVKYLYSLQGELLKTTAADRIDMQSLPDGLYFVLVKDEKGTVLKKQKVVKTAR
ncbi:endonuclease [Candidatus Sulfidibacterium hydrothermale]|uniref:endonuclease n=1 Tax=Candidatus Sulfidibacterium hydrothermale TaxID=2875962 RepID=UPI001F0ABC90|nr:endonuclease [Candidatus Sulfidibacterium hydrothermale]UBM61749.1 endonuclease [Candidatus Sulfidibacterium hydrothermale]